MSSDRIRRYIVGKNSSCNSSTSAAQKATDLLHIGDWCEFNEVKCIGQVIGFTYLTGSRKDRVYTLDSVPIKCPDTKVATGVGVLCNWYTIEDGFVLKIANTPNHKYVNINTFKAHLNKPQIDGNLNLVLNANDCILTDE